MKQRSSVEVNKQAPRTAFMTYDNQQNAQKALSTPYFQSLNGTWKFYEMYVNK